MIKKTFLSLSFLLNVKTYVYTLILIVFSAGIVYGQQDSTEASLNQEDALRVFLDVDRRYEEYIKTEIYYVNYVRDRKLAQVHIMMTEQRTGSGGTEHSLTFSGQLNFAAQNDTLICVTQQMDSEETTRSKIVQVLERGLVRYVNKTPQAEHLSVTFSQGRNSNEAVDKWNYWVFNANSNSRLNGEESSKSLNLRGSISADRITPDWKTSFDLNANYNKREYETTDETTSSITRSQDFRTLIVKSINEHWSTGFFGEVESSIFQNTKLSYNIAPAIEFNVYPYSESTRREFRFLYKIGVTDIEYDEETIFSEMKEILYDESLAATYELKKQWGSVESTLEGSHYFHDISKNRLQLDCNINLFLFQGLSFDIFGSVSRIHDQLSLRKAEATDEDLLLQRRQLATQYDYFASIGLRYTFGSIYSNVVNSRFNTNRGRGGF